MVQPGEPIPCPLGQPPQKRSKKAKGSAERELEEYLRLEDEWADRKCSRISKTIIDDSAMNPSATSFPGADPHSPFDFFNNLHRDQDFGFDPYPDPDLDLDPDDDSDISDSEPSSDEDDEVVQHLTSGSYQERRVREEKQWREILTPMFTAFMAASIKTLQWGSANWNTDWKAECRCSPSKKRTRPVDVVDIFTRSKIEITFCPCQPDVVRLIQMGFIGGSPTHPETAFSIRLLRLYHVLWKYCSTRIQPFARAIDEFLDPSNPLMVTQKTNKPRQWRRPLSSAVDAYRHMIRLYKELTIRALRLTKLEQLAANCPRCFGPRELGVASHEPDYIVCLDGNFQQRRHEAASVENSQIQLRYPALFVQPALIAKWRVKAGLHVDEPPDACTQMHTAANDTRTGSSWRGCDDTGLLGMVCRHDHALAFINIEKSGEKVYFAHTMIDWLLDRAQEPDDQRPKKFAFLYDIGCNLEKGIRRRGLFEQERNAGQLLFATSVFHSYVHNWGCQLDYNPRLNIGLGLSDGEGCERIWFELSSLVSPLRYSTKQRRLALLDLKADHNNNVARANSVQSIKSKLKIAKKTRDHNVQILDKIEKQYNYNRDYFSEQWTRQKTIQSEVIGDNDLQALEDHLARLIEFEEDLREEKKKLLRLRGRRRDARTAADLRDLASLPGLIVFLEEEIEEVLVELGSDRFRNMPGAAADDKGKALIRIQIAKQNLYEAKVGVIEAKRRWDEPGQGTKIQQRMKTLMNNKQSLLKKKWKTYHDMVLKFNDKYPSPDPLDVKTFEAVKSLDIGDNFWTFGELQHPQENWAVHEPTQKGIKAFLAVRSCNEELRRIAKEVRSVIEWSIVTSGKLESLRLLSEKAWERTARSLQLNLVEPSGATIPPRINKKSWDEHSQVLKSLYHSLSFDFTRIWLEWNCDLLDVLQKTAIYSERGTDYDEGLALGWRDLITACQIIWEKIVQGQTTVVQPIDPLEEAEQDLLIDFHVNADA